jgi:hypothetical protein
MSTTTPNVSTPAVVITPAASSTSSSSTSAARTTSGVGGSGSTIASATPAATTASPSVARRSLSAVSSLVSTIGSGIVNAALWLGNGILYIIATPFRAVRVLCGFKTPAQQLEELEAKITKDLNGSNPDLKQIRSEIDKFMRNVNDAAIRFKLFQFTLDKNIITGNDDVATFAWEINDLSTEKSVELIRFVMKNYKLSVEQLLNIMINHTLPDKTKIVFDKDYLGIVKELVAKIKTDAEVDALVNAAVKIISSAPNKLSEEITGEFVQTVLGLRRLTEAQAKLLLNIPLSEKNRSDATEKALKRFTNEEFARDITLNNQSIVSWEETCQLFFKLVKTNVARHVSEFAKKSNEKFEKDNLLQNAIAKDAIKLGEAHKLATEIYGDAYTKASQSELVKLGKETYDKSGTLSRIPQILGSTLARQKEPDFYQGYALSHAAKEANVIVQTAIASIAQAYVES